MSSNIHIIFTANEQSAVVNLSSDLYFGENKIEFLIDRDSDFGGGKIYISRRAVDNNQSLDLDADYVVSWDNQSTLAIIEAPSAGLTLSDVKSQERLIFTLKNATTTPNINMCLIGSNKFLRINAS